LLHEHDSIHVASSQTNSAVHKLQLLPLLQPRLQQQERTQEQQLPAVD